MSSHLQTCQSIENVNPLGIWWSIIFADWNPRWYQQRCIFSSRPLHQEVGIYQTTDSHWYKCISTFHRTKRRQPSRRSYAPNERHQNVCVGRCLHQGRSYARTHLWLLAGVPIMGDHTPNRRCASAGVSIRGDHSPERTGGCWPVSPSRGIIRPTSCQPFTHVQGEPEINRCYWFSLLIHTFFVRDSIFEDLCLKCNGM